MSDQHIIPTGDTTRLVVDRWDTSTGKSLVAMTPQFQDRSGDWKLAHSCVAVAPCNAQALAAAVLQVAAEIDVALVDPQPTEADRELSRRP